MHIAALPTSLDAALDFARQGLAIFPCNPHNKRPLVDDWPNRASADEAVIRRWWKQWPNAMIALPVGERAGCWVLDVDRDDDKGLDGEQSLVELVERNGPLPATAVSVTPRGGRHYFFRHPGRKVVNRAGRDGADLGKGLDVRGDGGYVVAAGSTNSAGASYSWFRDPAVFGFAEAPAWLVSLVVEPDPTPPSGAVASVRRDADTLSYVLAAMNEEARRVSRAGAGTRNDQLNTSAFSLGQFVGAQLVDRGTVESVLLDAAACSGLVADDGHRAVVATIRSGIEAGIGQPREIPDRGRDRAGQMGQMGQAAGQTCPAPTSEGRAVPDYGSGDKPEGRPGRLKLVTFDQIRPRLSSAKLVKGWLMEGAMSVVYGESGCGKTFLALDLALHVALGWDWRGRKVKQVPVVYVAAEGGFGISNRVEAFKRHHGLEDDVVPFAIIPTAVDLRDPDADLAELVEVVRGYAATSGAQIGLVIIDTLSRAMAGGNENAPDDMGAYVMNVDRLREETGAHVMSVHHSGKDGAKGARGHSLLRAALDTEIEVTKDPVTKSHWVRATKQKELPGEAEEEFSLQVVELGSDEDGEAVTSCVLAEASGTRERGEDDRGRHMAPRLRVALDMLRRAITAEGKVPPACNHIPANVQAVQVTVWREYCYAGQLSEKDTPESRRKAFYRASDQLQSQRKIATWGGWVWPTV